MKLDDLGYPIMRSLASSESWLSMHVCEEATSKDSDEPL